VPHYLACDLASEWKDLLEQMAKDENYSVRAEVAGDPNIPLGPKAVRVTGTLDTISATKSDVVLTLADGTAVAARLDAHDNQQLKTLFGLRVVVSGMAQFSPSGKLLVIDVEHLGPARDGDAVSVASLLPQDEASGVLAFFGTWPGDETDEDLLDALKAIR